MSTPRRTFITAALPYANGRLHIGHLAGCYLPADLYARFLRTTGHEVLFLSGSDEHGVPITISAEKEGVTPQAIVDRFHEQNKAAFAQLGISFDYYARTSSAVHRATSQEFFLTLYRGGYLEAREEPQLYDLEAKMFLPDRYVEGTCPVCSNPDARGDQCENCGTYLDQTELINPRSKVTGSTPVVRATKHWYFTFSKFQRVLEEWIESHADDWKPNVLQAARSWLKAGLQDRPITRDLNWGVPVPLPDADGKVLYVWFDAPIGYISATIEALQLLQPGGGADAWREWWQDEHTEWLAFLGKDNVVFHTLLFPAMLLAHNAVEREHSFQLPANVPGNEFMNLQGEKLSKSRGWTIEVHEIVERYPSDVIRYAFAMMLPETKDSDFQWKEFQAHVNNELADVFGNFVNRVLTFVHRNFDGATPPTESIDPDGQALLHTFETGGRAIAEHYKRFRFRDAVTATMDLARAANKYFNDAAPWKLIKQDRERAAQIMLACLEAVRALGVYFSPITPEASARIQTMLGSPQGESWQDAHRPKIGPSGPLGEVSILFSKIEDEAVDEEIKRLHAMADAVHTGQKEERAPQVSPELISIDDFKKVKLRTAKILEAERIPRSKKLIKLQLEVGHARRQIVAGIGEKFQPEELLGKTIIVVANLQPAKLMGQESQGMLLAVNDEHGVVTLVGLDSGAESGLEVR